MLTLPNEEERKQYPLLVPGTENPFPLSRGKVKMGVDKSVDSYCGLHYTAPNPSLISLEPIESAWGGMLLRNSYGS